MHELTCNHGGGGAASGGSVLPECLPWCPVMCAYRRPWASNQMRYACGPSVEQHRHLTAAWAQQYDHPNQ